MTRNLLIAAALVLAACATPAERCISNATQGLSELDAQIAIVEANVARGYRLQDRVIDTVGVDICSSTGNVRLCLGGEKEVEPLHVPIDVAAEQARLNAMLSQRARMAERMDLEIAACQRIG